LLDRRATYLVEQHGQQSILFRRAVGVGRPAGGTFDDGPEQVVHTHDAGPVRQARGGAGRDEHAPGVARPGDAHRVQFARRHPSRAMRGQQPGTVLRAADDQPLLHVEELPPDMAVPVGLRQRDLAPCLVRDERRAVGAFQQCMQGFIQHFGHSST
jgi:hypothetical protein